jgi:SET domain-containing protein
MRFNIDATRRGNAARFINHRCVDANTTLIIVWTSGALLPVVAIVARKNIETGEEITFSYGEEDIASEVPQEVVFERHGLSLPQQGNPTNIMYQPCLCGSSFCKGIMPMQDRR